jgi:peptide deformylase
MTNKLLIIDNDIDTLCSVSKTIDYDSEDLIKLIKPLKEYTILNNLYGIAGISLGIKKRIIYFNEAMINPLIIKKEGVSISWENCINTGNYLCLVKRPYLIEVEYLNIYGNSIKRIFKGVDSTHFMHLYDHLNGKVILDNALITFNMLGDDQVTYIRSHPYRILTKENDYNPISSDINKILSKKLTK